MTIAFVSLMRILPWGGSEELWFKTAKASLAKGYTVFTLTQKWEETPIKILELDELGAKSEFYYKPVYTLAERIYIKLKIKKYLDEFIPKVNADIYVISNGSTFDFIYHRLIIDAIIGTGKPYILISQHNFENGNIINIQQRDYCIDVISKSSEFLYVSKRNLESSERQMAYKVNHAKIISNPLNIVGRSIKKFPISDKLLLACVARLDCSFKGQDILLQTLSNEKWKKRNFILSLYGTGPHLDYLKALVLFYNLADKVKLVGHVNNIDEIWEKNQVLVLPSLSEGTPLALVEAMLSGRAALATDVGDNSEYVLDEQTGYLINVASMKAIDSGLEKIWQNKHKLQEMGVSAFNHAMTITDHAPDETLLSLIEKVVN